MDMIPMITKPDRSAMDGVRKLSHDLLIDNEVKRYKEQSSSIHYFQQRLDLERMVRPALAMGLQLEYEALKTDHARKVMLNRHVNIAEQYFSRSRAGKYVSPVKKLQQIE